MEGITFSSEAITILDYLCNKFGVVIDWTNANIVPKLQEIAEHIVSWSYWSSMVGVVNGAAMMIIGIIFLIVGIRRNKLYAVGKLRNLDGVIAIVFGSIIGVIGIPLVITHLLNMIKCNVFPEMVLIDYLLKLKTQLGG